MFSTRNPLIRLEFEWICLSCGKNVAKLISELTNFQRRKTNFIRRPKYAQQKTICFCIGVNKVYEVDHFKSFFEVLSKFKKKK